MSVRISGVATIPGTISTDVTTLLTRLSAARAGYLDNLSAGAVALNADMATVLTRLSAVRAGYLDNLSAGAVALNADFVTLFTRIPALAQMASITAETIAATTGITVTPSATQNTYGAWATTRSFTTVAGRRIFHVT